MQEIHCSAGWSTLLHLEKSAKGSPEREAPQRPAADFLVPLPEGERGLSPSRVESSSIRATGIVQGLSSIWQLLQDACAPSSL